LELDALSLFALASVSALLLMLTVWLSLSHTRTAVTVACGLILIAGTRFRVRDPLAAVTGSIDRAVLVELALYGLVAVIALAILIRRGALRTRLGVFERLLCAYVLVCLISAVWSLAPALTIVKSLQLVVLLALAIGAVRVVGPAATARSVMIAVVFYVLACTALVYVLPDLHARPADGRFTWFWMHPIGAGTCAGLATAITLAAGLYSPRGWRERLLGLPLWLYPLPLAAILVAAGSRGPLIACACAAGALFLKRLPVRIAVLTASAAILLMILFLASAESLYGLLVEAQATDNVIVRKLFRAQTADQVFGLSGRIELWQGVAPFLFSRPFTGYGYQGSRSILLETESWAGGAHNAYLQTLVDLGLLGALALWPGLLSVAVNAIPGVGRTGTSRWEEHVAVALVVFLLVNAITWEGFALGGFEGLVLFAAICIYSRVRGAESQTSAAARVRSGAIPVGSPLSPVARPLLTRRSRS
jgi:O-antigen ligase